MASLIETNACDGLLPISVGRAEMAECTAERITSVAPFKGRTRALGTGLKALGLGWPAPGTSQTSKAGSILWTGADQAFLIGADPAGLGASAALTDQSDGWARMRLAGPDAEKVLARLVALDLRTAACPVGEVRRSGLNHMPMVLWRSGEDAFEIFVFRSMAATAVHEMAAAMRAVAARDRFD